MTGIADFTRAMAATVDRLADAIAAMENVYRGAGEAL